MNRKLRTKIVEKFRTQTEFAIHMGIPETLVSKIVRGHRTLSPTDKSAWAKALETKVAYIFKRGQ